MVLLAAIFCSITACGDSNVERLDVATEDLKEHIDQLFAQDSFSGEVLVAKGDTILLQHARGYTNRDTQKHLDGDEKFYLGSLNKMFTAVAILSLVEDGSVALSDTLDTYLPEFENKSLSSKVTVHQLLTHTGGTGDIFGPLFEKQRLTLHTHDDYVELFEGRAATQVPGTQFQYSNFGFILLGKIIETVSNQDYYSFVQQRIFQPLEMSNTGFEPSDSSVVGLVNGYMKQNDLWVTNRETLPFRGTSAGGGYSTVSDLFKFAKALRDGTLLRPASVAQASAPHVPMGDAAYGYGMGVFGEDKLRFFGHNGGAPGMSAWLAIYPETGFIVIALSNYDPPIADDVVRIFTEQMPFE